MMIIIKLIWKKSIQQRLPDDFYSILLNHIGNDELSEADQFLNRILVFQTLHNGITWVQLIYFEFAIQVPFGFGHFGHFYSTFLLWFFVLREKLFKKNNQWWCGQVACAENGIECPMGRYVDRTLADQCTTEEYIDHFEQNSCSFISATPYEDRIYVKITSNEKFPNLFKTFAQFIHFGFVSTHSLGSMNIFKKGSSPNQRKDSDKNLKDGARKYSARSQQKHPVGSNTLSMKESVWWKF